MGWVVALIGIVLLYLRVQKLEGRITQLESGATITPDRTPDITPDRTPDITRDRTRDITRDIKAAPKVEPSGLELERFWNWFKADWPLKVGAFLMLLGFVWLVSYAF